MNLDKIISVRTNKTIFRDGDRAIKVFNSDFDKSDVLNEALNQSRVEATGLNVPKIIEVTKIEDKWAIVSEFIEGRTLEKIVADEPYNADKNLEFFVDIQLEVLSKRAPMLSSLREKMDRKISQADLDATTRYDLHMRLESMPKHSKLCHGDFNMSNIIVKDDGTPYILDWSHATQGNAAADAARTYLLYRLAGDNDTAAKYLNLFCKKSDTARQYVEKWLPIVAASQSVKGKPKEREFLLSWVSVVDYE